MFKSNLLMRLASCLVLVFLLTLVCLPNAQGAADERGLWEIWTKHQNADAKSEEVVLACMEYYKTHAGDPFVKVTDTIAAWHLLKLNKHAEAQSLLKRNLNRTQTSLGKGANQIASAWLSRADLLKIRAVLQFYYRKEVAYPDNLEMLANYKRLPKEMTFPLKDRWGNAWNYKLTGFKMIPNMLNQKYSIRCALLGLDSDLDAALKRPYGDKIKIKPLRKQKGNRPGSEYFVMAVGGEEDEDAVGTTMPKGAVRETYGLGTKKKNILLCYIGKNILVFSDRDHWEIVAKPRK